MDKSGPIGDSLPVNNMLRLLNHFSSQPDFLMRITDLQLMLWGKFQKLRGLLMVGIRSYTLGSTMGIIKCFNSK